LQLSAQVPQQTAQHMPCTSAAADVMIPLFTLPFVSGGDTSPVLPSCWVLSCAEPFVVMVTVTVTAGSWGFMSHRAWLPVRLGARPPCSGWCGDIGAAWRCVCCCGCCARSSLCAGNGVQYST
jgi:hypothetical protein